MDDKEPNEDKSDIVYKEWLSFLKSYLLYSFLSAPFVNHERFVSVSETYAPIITEPHLGHLTEIHGAPRTWGTE